MAPTSRISCPKLSPTARLSLQLGGTRSHPPTPFSAAAAAAAAAATLALDFPVPNRFIRTLHTTSIAKACGPTTTTTPRWRPNSAARTAAARPSCPMSIPSPRRSLHLHSSRPAPSKGLTSAVHNPLVADNGHESAVHITDRAAQRLTELMEKEANPNLALRIRVESGGCHGFQYLMSLVTLTPPGAGHDEKSELGEDDTVFVWRRPRDMLDGLADGVGRPKVVLDAMSLDLLNGSKVDFTMELIGSQFKIVDNPWATSSCGCGTSFDIKVPDRHDEKSGTRLEIKP